MGRPRPGRRTHRARRARRRPGPGPLQRLRALWAPRHPHEERNTPDGSRANISRHYDLSNDLFALFLDDTLTYSSALFRGFPANWDLLAAAQHRKIDRLLDLADVGEGTRLLEIGTGWGELALRAAARGARVTSLTLSREQRALARERVRAAGLDERVSIELCDYREARGTYDAVVSVEMIEAVGAEFWPVYFRALDARLAPGAARRCRPSPCRTSGWSPPAPPSRGSTSTSSPAG